VETSPEHAAPADSARPVTIINPVPPVAKPISVAVLGAVKAGKSSLVNALLGKQTATMDRLPSSGGTRYAATLPGGRSVSILDSSGYGERISDTDFDAAVEASREADMILLVTPANNPGRAADVDLLDRLKQWFADKPHLRMPPVVVVVNQVDLLSPKAEWTPPYNWNTGTRPKEVNIRECLGAVREQIGSRAVDYVPVCARDGETFNVFEGLVPAVVAHLDEARGSAILKAFEAGASERAAGRVADQVGNLVHVGLGALAGWLKKK
jgi:predicted GTPase